MIDIYRDLTNDRFLDADGGALSNRPKVMYMDYGIWQIHPLNMRANDTTEPATVSEEVVTFRAAIDLDRKTSTTPLIVIPNDKITLDDKRETFTVEVSANTTEFQSRVQDVASPGMKIGIFELYGFDAQGRQIYRLTFNVEAWPAVDPHGEPVPPAPITEWVEEAPATGKLYGRKDKEWEEVSASGIGAAAVVHSHTISQVSGLQATLNSKAALSHTHTIAQIASLQITLNSLQSQITNLQSAAVPVLDSLINLNDYKGYNFLSPYRVYNLRFVGEPEREDQIIDFGTNEIATQPKGYTVRVNLLGNFRTVKTIYIESCGTIKNSGILTVKDDNGNLEFIEDILLPPNDGKLYGMRNGQWVEISQVADDQILTDDGVTLTDDGDILTDNF